MLLQYNEKSLPMKNRISTRGEGEREREREENKNGHKILLSQQPKPKGEVLIHTLPYSSQIESSPSESSGEAAWGPEAWWVGLVLPRKSSQLSSSPEP